MKRHILNTAFTAALIALITLILPTGSTAGDKKLEETFAPVMKLKGTPAEGEINAIANLLAGENGIMTHDFSAVSGEFCMLEKGTKNNMIHFSETPESTTEDIIYFISPDTFKSKGLKVKKLSKMPGKLGVMEPLKWYYYDGKSVEPHHGKKLHRDFLVMAIDVK